MDCSLPGFSIHGILHIDSRGPAVELWAEKEQMGEPGFLFVTAVPGESHGQRSVAGYSPWGHKESDTTERLILLLPDSVKDKEYFS